MSIKTPCIFCGSRNVITVGGDNGDPFGNKLPQKTVCLDCGRSMGGSRDIISDIFKDMQKELFGENGENTFLTESYKRLLEIMSNEKDRPSSFFELRKIFTEIIDDMNCHSFNEEDFEFVNKCETKMIPFYQRALDENYKRISALTLQDIKYSDDLMITFDEDRNVCKTEVIGVKDGSPVFSYDCDISLAINIFDIEYYMSKLPKWFAQHSEFVIDDLKKALDIKKEFELERAKNPPKISKERLTREQADAIAWRELVEAQEKAEVSYTEVLNTEETLDLLIKSLERSLCSYASLISILT